MKFVDEVKILLKSGCGGTGCVSFSREPLNPRGGPDGGDGGHGGHVIFQVNPHLNTLFHLQGKRQLSAKNGQSGSSKNRKGSSGSNLIIEVPPGTTICDLKNQELVDLISDNHLFLKGGRGGKGNNHYKSSINQTPQQFQQGEQGQTAEVTLKMKLIADIGVIGFPNTGKSTLVSALTGAKTKIDNYPFTTLKPQLGILKKKNRVLTLADTPGIIPGASQGVGFGFRFLRHIERTKIFVHLLDISDFSDRDIWDDYLKMIRELKAYDTNPSFVSSNKSPKTLPKNIHEKREFLESHVPLAHRPQIVVFNKIDIAGDKRVNYFKKNSEIKGLKW